MIGKVTTFNEQRAGGSLLPARLYLCAAALASSTMIFPSSALATAAAAEVSRPIAGQTVADFYAARHGQPLWLQGDGEAAAKLLELLRTADADGLDPANYRTPELDDALRAAWGGKPAKVRNADMLLSQVFVAYVRDLKAKPAAHGIVWVDPELKPAPPSAFELLGQAVAAPSINAWIADMRFMHPIYAGLRSAILRAQGDPDEQRILRLNLDRARALPSGGGRHIVVNATAQRLEMYEDGQVVDSMKVVVGKPKNPTPMMAALIRFASLNPYWYVPPDLTAERIAPNVLKEGLSYLDRQGYEVFSNWNDESTRLDPALVDWKAVEDGTTQVRVRQLPGKYNAMGVMKFMFPNSEGIYLHDTPQKELLTEASRMFSGGCIRLEDAPRLGRWLFGKPLEGTSDAAEYKVDLPRPVPVYITYLTVVPEGSQLATYPDVYNRDRDQLALAGGSLTVAH